MAEQEKTFDFLNPFISVDLGLSDWADGIKTWASANRDAFQPTKRVINEMIVGIDTLFQSVPPIIMLIILALIAWQAAGRRVAILVIVSMSVLGFLAPNAWGLAMTTLAIVVSSVILCVLIGLPLGILTGKNDLFEQLMRPFLDTMQTIPAFVYL
ncbi:uncharacterized protein METZ01_LOCUS516561, partial [marine metagenome]